MNYKKLDESQLREEMIQVLRQLDVIYNPLPSPNTVKALKYELGLATLVARYKAMYEELETRQ